MSAPITITKDLLQEAINAFYKNGKRKDLAAKELRLSYHNFSYRLSRAKELNMVPTDGPIISDAELFKIKANKEISDLKALNMELRSKVYDVEKIKQLIHECDQSPSPPKWLTSKTSGTNTGIPTLFCSDWHWDEVVVANQVNGVNAFNRSIAIKRAQTLFTKTSDLLIHHMANPKYDRLVIALGGDMLSGNIHEELRETNESPISKSIVALLDILIAGIDFLLPHFKFIEVNAVPGNHGRWDHRPRFKNRVFENYEWLLYQFLIRHYRGNDQIYFNIADGADLLYKIYDTRYLLTHGDQFKGGTGIAGALSPLMLGDARKRKRSMATNQLYDYMLMGHWHQMFFFKGIIVNGSLKGFDEYAFQNNYDFELPTQALWVTHPTWGITARWPVYLEKPNTRY